MKTSTIPHKHIITLLAMCLLPCLAWSQAYVTVRGGNRVDVEKILVRPDGSLVVTVNGQPQNLSKEQYVQAVGVKPAGIDQAQALINEGKNEEAAVILEEVINSSRFLSWDAFAGEKLASIQLAEDEPLQAKRTLDKLERRYGDEMLTFFPFLEKIQWEVKIESGNIVGLEEELTEIIQSRNDVLRKGRALIVRGDLKASRKDFESAVLDFLRVDYFFGNNRQLRAEALYKTASMFAKIGDTGRLKKYTTLLKETYPDSEYANREIGS